MVSLSLRTGHSLKQKNSLAVIISLIAKVWMRRLNGLQRFLQLVMA
ncbi:UNVERIFIED_CONTAM: hypothetical protein GTU68_040311, partial [Idotea baltica]|nr:hypothetical protein [Idotea baltica]